MARSDRERHTKDIKHSNLKKKNHFNITKWVSCHKQLAIVSSVLAILVLVSIGVFAASRVKPKANDVDDKQHNRITVGEIKTEGETETETEAETAAEEEIIPEEEIERFFAEEISTEDEDPYQLRPRDPSIKEVVPYDGVSRSISCWGDSMTNGGNAMFETITVDGVSFPSPTYPKTLQYLTGINTYNLGAGGETARTIATRQGGLGMVTDRDIDLTQGSTEIFHLISTYTGAEVRLPGSNGEGDYSGYNYDPHTDVCVIDGNKYIITYNDDGTDTHSISFPTRSLLKTISVVENQVRLPYMTDITMEATAQVAGYLEPTTVQEPTSQGPTQGTIQGIVPPTTETTTQQPTTEAPTKEPEKTTEAPQPSSVSIPAGSAVYTLASFERKNDILILEIGSNDCYNNAGYTHESDFQQLIDIYDAMIEFSGCKYYIIIGDTDDPAQEDIGLGNTAWESTLEVAYGDHFLNMRQELIKNGLSDCGLNWYGLDYYRAAQGCVSTQLAMRSAVYDNDEDEDGQYHIIDDDGGDNTHLKGYGYYAKGVEVYKKGRSLGYW